MITRDRVTTVTSVTEVAEEDRAAILAAVTVVTGP